MLANACRAWVCWRSSCRSNSGKICNNASWCNISARLSNTALASTTCWRSWAMAWATWAVSCCTIAVNKPITSAWSIKPNICCTVSWEICPFPNAMAWSVSDNASRTEPRALLASCHNASGTKPRCSFCSIWAK